MEVINLSKSLCNSVVKAEKRHGHPKNWRGAVCGRVAGAISWRGH